MMVSLETPREQITQRVQHFLANKDFYLSPIYKETAARQELIDPFFAALGWDIRNERRVAPQYREVVTEESLEVEGYRKVPDYVFRVGPSPKFFVEAKKPAVSIEDNPAPAYQLRRYAWTAKLPLSILTNFREFAVYDCRIRPYDTDKTSAARIRYYTCEQYADRWEEIAGLFSRDAVWSGTFDRFAHAETGKRGTGTVDEEFLREIESWRDILARNIALRNPDLAVEALNVAVQRTVDRLVFLRICEDRGIEEYGQLQGLLSREGVYRALCEIFYRADHRYNSGLFHFQKEPDRQEPPDELTLRLHVDDKPLKDIIRNLYFPASPYEFSVLPADVLGQVYEQFLGKVIRLTPAHQTKVEDKPEVRKAGGVYYTPTFIVEYIVKHTVGQLLEGKSPGDIAGDRSPTRCLRIMDPACGSGSFLLGAYEYLLTWYRDWYVNDGPEKWASGKTARLIRLYNGDWRLTVSERKRILLTHIFGVDIDPQAVEVSKLSLLLKVLEGENERSLAHQMELIGERVLPDLGRNIQCGNSLIGPEYFTEQLVNDGEELKRINPLDWPARFPDAVEAGGFDCVIGNPPYVRQEQLGVVKEYLSRHYRSFKATADLYVMFVEKGHRLLRPGGVFGMILSNKWLRAAYGAPLRAFLQEHASIGQVIDLAGWPVFSGVTVRPIILITRVPAKPRRALTYLPPLPIEKFRSIESGDDLAQFVRKESVRLPQTSLSQTGWSFAPPLQKQILERMKRNAVPLKEYIHSRPYRGLITGLNKAFLIDRKTRDRLVARNRRAAEIIKPVLAGRDVRRFSIRFNEQYLLWTYIGVPIKRYPAVLAHLKPFQSLLSKRWDRGNTWWELRACDYYERFEKPKIIYPDIATTCRFALDRTGYFGVNTTYFLPTDDLCLLGILNSRLSNFYFGATCAGLEGDGQVYLRFFSQYVEGFPLPPLDAASPSDRKRKARLVQLVEQMIALQEQLQTATEPRSRELLQRQAEHTDREIDRVVYDLYGLTDAEIAFVEQRNPVAELM